MATDYDAPRRGDVDELHEDSIEELKARRVTPRLPALAAQ